MVLMEGKHGVGKVLERLDSACPSGFAIALHIKFSSPRYLFQAYPAEWIAYYTANGLVMRDPTVHWGFENTGHIRWSALEIADRSVMLKAAEHGLKFGFTVAIDALGSRTVASFARSDREFIDSEMVDTSELLAWLHAETLFLEDLSPEDDFALRRLSILLTRG